MKRPKVLLLNLSGIGYRGRSDTVMITKNFNSYANLAMFFIVLVLICFVFEHETLTVFDFYYHT